MFSFFEDMEKGRADRCAVAAKAAAGLSAEQLVPGAVVTLSTCRATGDRSWTGSVWEVVATNGGHAKLKWCGGEPRYSGADPFIFVQIHERQFYPAEHLLGEA